MRYRDRPPPLVAVAFAVIAVGFRVVVGDTVLVDVSSSVQLAVTNDGTALPPHSPPYGVVVASHQPTGLACVLACSKQLSLREHQHLVRQSVVRVLGIGAR